MLARYIRPGLLVCLPFKERHLDGIVRVHVLIFTNPHPAEAGNLAFAKSEDNRDGVGVGDADALAVSALAGALRLPMLMCRKIVIVDDIAGHPGRADDLRHSSTVFSSRHGKFRYLIGSCSSRMTAE